jgi:hypothetical protein
LLLFDRQILLIYVKKFKIKFFLYWSYKNNIFMLSSLSCAILYCKVSCTRTSFLFYGYKKKLICCVKKKKTNL